jgi:hypothetical protein
MTTEDALKAMSAVENLFDGSEQSAEAVAQLAIELVERPETFWEMFFDSVNEDDPTRREAKRLIEFGIVDGSTTFAELHDVLRK